MFVVNTVENTNVDSDWDAGAQMPLSEGLLYWLNDTGRDVRVRLSFQNSGPGGKTIAAASQVLTFIPNIHTSTTFSADNDLVDSIETFQQDVHPVSGAEVTANVYYLKNEIIVAAGSYLAYTIKSSSAGSDTDCRVTANTCKLWDVVDYDVNVVEVGSNTPESLDAVITDPTPGSVNDESRKHGRY